MALLGQEFRLQELPESSGFDPLPAGWYTATIASADLKDTRAGTGQYIAIRYDVTGPSHAGRVVFGNINIKNPNPQAEEIGRKQLGELMRAIGLDRVVDTDQLLGGNVQIKLAITKSEQYGEQNDVKGVKAVDGTTPMAAPASGFKAPGPAPAPAATPAPAAGATPPWAKK